MVQLLKDGAVTQEYAYDAYGYINADEFGIQAPFYGYNGEEQNPFTGLQYLRARYYAPQNGGFITQDSFSGVLTNALSQNQYTYAHNNPVNYADPSGHSIWDSIKNGVTNAVNSVKNFVSSVANKVSSAVSSAVNAVKSAVTGTTTKTVANTSSAVKKSYTNTAVRQKIGSYAGGAAAAAAGNVSTSYSNSVVGGVVADSRIPFTNATGQTLLLPQHFSDVQASAQEFTRQGCAEGLEHVGSQQGWDGLTAMALSSTAGVLEPNQLAQAIAEFLASLGVTLKNVAVSGLVKVLTPFLLVLSLSGDTDQRMLNQPAESGETTESTEKSPVAEQSTPANPPPNKPDDDFQRILDELLEDATPGRKTKGKSQQWEKPGDINKAMDEFNKFNPDNVRDINTQYGPGKSGTLPDGSSINVRPGSSFDPNSPTIEIIRPNGIRIKIRYGG